MPSTIPRGIQILNAAIQRLFELLVALLFLAPPSYFERGVFSWFPLYTIRMDDRHFSIGLLALLDPVIALGWLAVRLATRSAKPWNWGRTGITLPLLGLSLLLLSRLNPHTPLFSAQSVANLTIMWFVYFFILNERPRLWLPLAVVAILLGVIALGQFMTQGDLGLTWLGELPLDPSTRGIVVLQVDGQRLLRAYGLNAPNATAAILVTCVLLLLQHLLVLKGGARWLVVLSCAIGLLGALTTFSRAAWLAFLLALLIWLVWLISASTPGTATPPDCGLLSGA
jgi:hypothetical protein